MQCFHQDRANSECLAPIKNRTGKTYQRIRLTKVNPSNEPMRRISAALVGTMSNAPNKKAFGSEAGKQPGNNAVGGRDTALPKSPMSKHRANPKPTQPILDEGTDSQPFGKSAPNGERASEGNASASLTHLTSRKDQAEGTVTCRICQQSLPVTEFSKSQLKKLKKSKAKGNPMPIVCSSCTMSNMPNKKASGSEAANQLVNGRVATVSKSRTDNNKGMKQSPNNFQNQQCSSKATTSPSQPAAATRNTHESTAKRKSRDSEKQPKEVMTAAAKRVVI